MEGNKGQRPRPGPRRKGEEQRTATTPAHSASATHHRNKTPQRTAANHVSYLEHRFFARSRSYCSEKGAARGRGGGPVRAAQQSKRTVRAVNAGTPHCTPAPWPQGHSLAPPLLPGNTSIVRHCEARGDKESSQGRQRRWCGRFGCSAHLAQSAHAAPGSCRETPRACRRPVSTLCYCLHR